MAQRTFPLFIMAAGASGCPKLLGLLPSKNQLPGLVLPLGAYNA
jgi:hypothetical protein